VAFYACAVSIFIDEETCESSCQLEIPTLPPLYGNGYNPKFSSLR